MKIHIWDYWTQVTWESQARDALAASFMADISHERIFIKMSCSRSFDLLLRLAILVSFSFL